jgi:Fe-S-cluster containining protein
MSPDPFQQPDACQRCGACCASFRVDFSVHETESEGGRVPDALADALNGRICRLRGTDHAHPRCAALTGAVGQRVACGIYEWRPSPCRELEAGSDACLRARARHGIAPDRLDRYL